MKRLVMVILATSLTGCSSLGDLQVWNDMGSTGRSIGSIFRTVDSSCKVISGYSCGQSNLNTSNANITYGNAKQMPYYYRTGQPETILAETLKFFR